MKNSPDLEAAREPGTAATAPRRRSVAVILPCYNEEVAIGDVVAGFRDALPDARIYVYDNASTDATAKRALDAGAIVRAEPKRGKGNVVRRMFADIDADIYVMADGDGTYDASRAPALIERLVGDTSLERSPPSGYTQSFAPSCFHSASTGAMARLSRESKSP